MCLCVGTLEAADSVYTWHIPNDPVQVAFCGCRTQLRFPALGCKIFTFGQTGKHQGGSSYMTSLRRGLLSSPKPSMTQSGCGVSLRQFERRGVVDRFNITTSIMKMKTLQKTSHSLEPASGDDGSVFHPGGRPDSPKKPARAQRAAFHLCVKRCKCFMD